MTVDRVTQHHQGSGLPHNDPGEAANGGYSAWIGATTFTMLRPPEASWATFGWNHRSFDVCLSGNRDEAPVTDLDLDLMRQCAAEARRRGWIVDHPVVYPHGTIHPPPKPYPSGSSPTECPGTNTIARWPAVYAAYDAAQPTPTPGDDDVPKDKDFVSAFANSEGAWELQYDGGVRTVRGPFYGSYFTLPASVRNDPTRRFHSISAAFDGGRGYTLLSVKGEPYTMNVPQ